MANVKRTLVAYPQKKQFRAEEKKIPISGYTHTNQIERLQTARICITIEKLNQSALRVVVHLAYMMPMRGKQAK